MKSVYYDILKTFGEFVDMSKPQKTCHEESTFTFNKNGAYSTLDNEAIDVMPLPLSGIDSAKNGRSYTTFSGCDMVLCFDGEVVGEVQGITFACIEKEMANCLINSRYFDGHLLDTHPIAIKIDYIMFDRTHKIADGTNLVISYANEYGEQAYRMIKGLKQLWSVGSHSVNQLTSNYSLYCCAESLGEMKSRSRTICLSDFDSKIAASGFGMPIRPHKDFLSVCYKAIGKFNNSVTKNFLDSELCNLAQFKDIDAIVYLDNNDTHIKKLIVEIDYCSYMISKTWRDK